LKLSSLQHADAIDFNAARALRGHVPGLHENPQQLRLSQFQRNLLPDVLERVSFLQKKRKTELISLPIIQLFRLLLFSKSENAENRKMLKMNKNLTRNII